LNVISGKESTNPIPGTNSGIILSSEECASRKLNRQENGSNSVSSGSDADVPLDDFMEEIRREEEESRQKRAKEIQEEKLAEEQRLKELEEEEAKKKAAPGIRKVKRVVKKKSA
jgi:hypothetical protein